jgi:hypothetical protein
MSMMDRLRYPARYIYMYHPTHDGIHESLLKYTEEQAGKSLEHLKLERLKDSKIKSRNLSSQYHIVPQLPDSLIRNV